MSKRPDNGRGNQQNRKDRAILALVQGGTVEKAAAASELHPSTLNRWLQEPDFRNKLREARQTVYSQGVASLQLAVHLAASRLVALATCKDTPPTAAIAACNSILNHAAHSFQLDQFELRLSKLEELADKRSEDKKAQNRVMAEEAIGRAQEAIGRAQED
jgi:hypothetical protein